MAMLKSAHRCAARVPGLRRAAARALDEAGDTMIEVVIAALIVALAAAAVFTGFGAVADISGAQRHQEEAASLAEQASFRLRGLNSTELEASEPSGSTSCNSAQLYGNSSCQQIFEGQTYTITTTSTFVSASGSGTSCTSSGSANADYIETGASVIWGTNNDGRQPVVVHSLISPNPGGALIAKAEDDHGNPLTGVTITISGPSPSTATTTLTTDANGCVVFSGLNGGIYSLNETDPGYGAPGTTTQSEIVVAGETIDASEVTFGLLGSVTAQFITYQNGTLVTALPWDTFSLGNSGATGATTVSPVPGPFGTPSSTATSVNTGSTLYPTIYDAYAGACTTDDPQGATGQTAVTGLTGSTYYDPTVTVPDGANGNVTVIVPTMLLKLQTQFTTAYTPWNDSSASYSNTNHNGVNTTWTTVSNANDYGGSEHDTANTNATATFTFNGTGVEVLGTMANNWGEASVTIDGNFVTNIDFQSTTTQYNQPLWSDLGTLANGAHTLVITNIHQNDSVSNGYTIGLDEFYTSAPGTGATWTVNSSALPYAAYTYDSCGTGVERTVPTSGVGADTLMTVSGSPVYPVAAPYGNSVQVCFSNPVTSSNTGLLPSTTQISNTNLRGTTVTSLTLPTTSGATGASALFANSGTTCPT
jgi:type II secretory pathway pseudopilin PulG